MGKLGADTQIWAKMDKRKRLSSWWVALFSLFSLFVFQIKG